MAGLVYITTNNVKGFSFFFATTCHLLILLLFSWEQISLRFWFAFLWWSVTLKWYKKTNTESSCSYVRSKVDLTEVRVRQWILEAEMSRAGRELSRCWQKDTYLQLESRNTSKRSIVQHSWSLGTQYIVFVKRVKRLHIKYSDKNDKCVG